MMDDLYLENEECILPSIDLPIYMPVHSFINSLFSLLTSTDLMRSEHLLFADKHNPAYVPPQDPNGNYGDVNTGDAYYRFHDGIKNKSDTVLVSLMIFADGMCIDKYGQHGQEPWMYMLGIFNRAMRQQPRAWRNLGLTKSNCTQQYSTDEIGRAISEMENPLPKKGQYNYVAPDMLNWHRQVSTIFQMLLEIQQFVEGMKWVFVIDGCEIPKLYSIVLPILVVMGDMPFLNKVVGMHRNLQGKRVCQMCNIDCDHLDDPYCSFVETDSDQLRQKMLTDPVKTKDLGYYPMKQNIFHHLQFCHAKGVNQSAPVEPLHCVLLGLFIRLLQGFNRLQKKGMIDRIAEAHANGQKNKHIMYSQVIFWLRLNVN